MSLDMIAIELNPQNIDRIMAVASFVWPTLTTEELVEIQENALLECETYYFVPVFIGKYSSPHNCPYAVFLRGDILEEDFDYEITDPTQPFTIARKS